MSLLSEWSRASEQWNTGAGPYFLEADARFLENYKPGKYNSKDEARSALGCWEKEKKSKRLHLELLPIPFMGDLLNASIYVLMDNPGYNPCDHLEFESPTFRQALLANLKQERLDGFQLFPYLDLQFSWHPGFNYWDKKAGLGKIISTMAKKRGISEAEARAYLCDRFGVIQTFPYHSRVDGLNLKESKPDSWPPSVSLAGEFVKDTVVQRVKDKQAIVLLIRCIRIWNKYLPDGLKEEHGVIRSKSPRNVSLNPANPEDPSKNPCGRAMLRHLSIMT